MEIMTGILREELHKLEKELLDRTKFIDNTSYNNINYHIAHKHFEPESQIPLTVLLREEWIEEFLKRYNKLKIKGIKLEYL